MRKYHTNVDLKIYFEFRQKLFENYSEINLSQIIKSGEEAINKLSNASNIAEAAEKMIEDAAETFNIIQAKNDSGSTI